ncbi:MAG: metallophosphoesterase family protein [Microbacteriaceae bacterium]
MSTRLLLISDTHVPQRASALPDSVWRAIDAAEVVFHAGDWVGAELLEQLERRTPRVIGVCGNNDPDLRTRLPEIARVEVDGIRFAMIHQTGQADGREKRCDLQFPDVAVLVFGHSHIPWDSISPNGLRLLNPGSPTDHRKEPAGTYLTAIADCGVLHDVVLHAV